MDTRRQKTRDKIVFQYRRLLINVGYDDITVDMILKAVPVARSTFYSHFRSIDDIAVSFCDQMFDHILAPKHEKEFGHDFSAYDGIYSPNQDLAHIFYHFMEAKGFLDHLLKCKGSFAFLQALRRRLNPFFMKLASSDEYSVDNVPTKITALMMSEAFIGLLTHWLDMGCISSPEHAAHFFIKTFRRVK